MKQVKEFKKIYEDDFILVINKAPLVLTIPDRWNDKLPSLQSLLKQEYNEIFTVHRLDRDTSGIMVYAKNAEIHKYLNTLFEKQEIEKIYHAIVEGQFDDEPIEVDIPILTDPANKGKSIPSARGKSSLTKVKLIKNFRNSALVKCMLVTGRHHQIRVHLSAIGHPLLVDNIYGNNEEFKVSSIKKKFNLKKNTTENPMIIRNTLHAYSLKFIHPITNQEVEFTAEYPKDFAATIQVLEKYS
jgi:RluA family pseudouridine synthase